MTTKQRERSDSMSMTLRALRVNQDLSVESVAEKLGCSIQAIYDWETNKYKPNAKYVAKMAQLYKCKTDDIFNIFLD